MPMTKDKKPEKKHVAPSREGMRYVYLPKKLADEMQDFADTDDRSLSYMVRKACEEYRDARKKRESGGK